jgi:hypothetical protein
MLVPALLWAGNFADAFAQTDQANARWEVTPIIGYRGGVKAARAGVGRARTEVGGFVLGAQARRRLLPNLSAFTTLAHSGWRDRPPTSPGEVTRGGSFRWLIAGLSLDVKLKSVNPLSLVVAPGIIEERYPDAAFEDPPAPAYYPVLAYGLEAIFPLRDRVVARGGMRNQFVYWQDENTDPSHMLSAYFGIGVSWH